MRKSCQPRKHVLRSTQFLRHETNRDTTPRPAINEPGYLIPVEHLDWAIIQVRGKRVILSHDLAAAYGVTAKRLNEQVKRNAERFPGDFVFQLTSDEKTEVVANCDHLALLRFSPSLPYAFTAMT